MLERLVPSGGEMLPHTCTIASFSSKTFNPDTGNDTESIGSGTAYSCLAAPAGSRWATLFPQASLDGALEVYLQGSVTVAVQDKLTYNSLAYRVIGVDDYDDAFKRVLCERFQGVTS